VIVHCGAGIGRAGTTAILVLMALGLSASDAAAAVAAARPMAGPEAGPQRDLVDAYAAHQRAV
jgi:protein-tyrosine phosphatase